MARLRAGLRHALLALVVLATGVAVALPRTDLQPAAGEQRPMLVDDDGGRPMFTVPALAPGKTFTRCIRVTYRGRGARLRLTGDIGGSGLAEQLRLRIERGSGGGYDSCSGFRGTAIYDGSVDSLRGNGARVAHDLKPGDEPTYRFTVSAPHDLAADALTATAAFTWEATEGPGSGPSDAGSDDPAPGAPSAPAPAAPAPSAPASPAPASPPGDGSAPSTTPPDDAARDGMPGRGENGRGAAPASPDRDPRSSGPPAPRTDDDRGGGFTEALREALRKLASIATDGAKRGAFPLVLLLLMAAFVVVQHRIDSRDPKLALAPVHADVDLPFAEFESAPISTRTSPRHDR